MNVDLTQLHGRRVCVALSGGRDSVCLLHVLRACAGKEGITLSALTCEHGIRGEESLADLAFTERLCRDWGVPLRVFRADVPALARVRKQGLEEAGRNFRYACFEQILAEGAADVVATAHHLDDAAETVLFRLARGTSLAGLNVFPARQGIARPFLGVTRAEIDRYMERFRLPFAEDKSNSDERFSRNLLRSRVMPALADIVPNAAEHIAAFAVRASEDDAYLRSLACAALTERGGAVCVPVGLPAPVFSRACLAALAACGVERDYTSANLAEIARLTVLQSGRKATLPEGVTAVREGSMIAFLPAQPQNDGAELPFGHGTFSVGGYTVMVGETYAEGALVADMDAFPEGCVIRTRREGDVFAPFGGGTKPLKKFLTDKKIPARIGHAIPLVACGGEVFAVFGTEISEKVRLTERTVRRGYLSIIQTTEEN